MNIKEIEAIIPHRYPFLFIDRITELLPGKRAVGQKKVSINDFFLQTGPNGKHLMPPVLILEAMGQVGAVAILSCPQYRNKSTLLAGIDKACFLKDVMPGDVLRLEAEITQLKGKIGRRKCQALVGDTVVAKAEILFALTRTAKPPAMPGRVTKAMLEY